MGRAFQEFLNEAFVGRIPTGPNGTLQAFGQSDQILGQIGADQIGVDATQRASQMLSDRIAENNGVGQPNFVANHEVKMLVDQLGFNAKFCDKLTQPST
jgi:hypothetical protein